jgi:hypothetical protein
MTGAVNRAKQSKLIPDLVFFVSDDWNVLLRKTGHLSTGLVYVHLIEIVLRLLAVTHLLDGEVNCCLVWRLS